MPRTLKCAAVLMGLFVLSTAHAIFIGGFPGLTELIDTADAIVILRTERCLSGYRTTPPYYKEYECTIYQSLKGDIPKFSLDNLRVKLKLFDPETAFKTPFAHGADHLMFLSKKITEEGEVEYYSLCMKGAYVPLSPLGNEKMPEGDTLEEKVRNVIKGAIKYENQQHEKKQAFLEKMLGGKYVGMKRYKKQAAREAKVLLPLSPRNDLKELSEQKEINFDEYDAKQLVQMVAYFHRHHKHSKAVQAGEAALKRISSHDEQDAMIRYYMAKSYEALQDGFRAKSKYHQILTMHSEYCRNIEIAYRLAELNSSIILNRTEPDTEKAVKWHRYVIEHYEHPNIVYYEVLKSHMGLGILLWDQSDYDAAVKHFEAIYKVDPAFAAPSPYKHFENDRDYSDHIEWLQDRMKGIKKKSREKLVNICIRLDTEESVKQLEKLKEKFNDDVEIINMADAKISELKQR